MDLLEAAEARHSVRKYTDKPIESEIAEELRKDTDLFSEKSGLDIKLILDEPKAFGGLMAKWGSFRNVKNYIMISGSASDSRLDEKAGYYGERLVLKAQQLGLNTCWVCATYNKKSCIVPAGERLVCVIALGYGENQGVPHKNKAFREICHTNGYMPEWFRKGVECAALAPTAMNRQNFVVILSDDNSRVEVQTGSGAYSQIDKGIVELHFEIGTGKSFFGFQ